MKPPSAADVFVLSAAAKLGATIVTYPLQLIKARQMSAGKHTHADRKYAGTLDAILRIWRSEGEFQSLPLYPSQLCSRAVVDLAQHPHHASK